MPIKEYEYLPTETLAESYDSFVRMYVRRKNCIEVMGPFLFGQDQPRIDQDDDGERPATPKTSSRFVVTLNDPYIRSRSSATGHLFLVINYIKVIILSTKQREIDRQTEREERGSTLQPCRGKTRLFVRAI